jgi:hypothetical protein
MITHLNILMDKHSMQPYMERSNMLFHCPMSNYELIKTKH